MNDITIFRAFADIYGIGKLPSVEGLLALKERWGDVAHIRYWPSHSRAFCTTSYH